MKVGTVSMEKLTSEDRCIYTNIIVAAIRSRQIIDDRYEKVEMEKNIEDSEQLETLIHEEDLNAPKAITTAVKELFDGELEFKLLNEKNRILIYMVMNYTLIVLKRLVFIHIY